MRAVEAEGRHSKNLDRVEPTCQGPGIWVEADKEVAEGKGHKDRFQLQEHELVLPRGLGD